MKVVIGSVVAAVGASICCIGPVVFTALGVGTLSAAAVRFEVYRPGFLIATTVLLAAGFYTTYRPSVPENCRTDGACPPASKRVAKIVLWFATLLVILLVTFPYYVNLLL